MDSDTLTSQLAGSCYQLCLSDPVWRSFGFNRRPRWSGSIFRPFRSHAVNTLEPAIYLELLRLGLANIAFALRFSMPRSSVHAVLAEVFALCLNGTPKSPQPWEFTVRYKSFVGFVDDVASGAADYTATPGLSRDLSIVLVNHGPDTDRAAFVRWLDAGVAFSTDSTLLDIRNVLSERILLADVTEYPSAPLQGSVFGSAADRVLAAMYNR